MIGSRSLLRIKRDTQKRFEENGNNDIQKN